MDIEGLLDQMTGNVARIRSLVQVVPDAQARWKPDEDSWSILEVVTHLADEERFDFRVRLDYTLHRPGERWPPIDPQAWVKERHLDEGNLDEVMASFVAVREDSLRWLRTLEQPDWEATYQAAFGPIKAGEVMAAWLGHDFLHMRQLVRLHWRYLEREVAPYRLEYAGRW